MNSNNTSSLSMQPSHPTVCRHCAEVDLAGPHPTYASVLVCGTDPLESVVREVESQIIPCIAALCPVCCRMSILSTGTQLSVLGTIVTGRRLSVWLK